MILCYKKKKLLTRLKIIFFIIFFIIDIKDILSQESILSKGDWIRIGITENGVYKLDRSFFESYSSKIDIEKIVPSTIQIFGSGIIGPLTQNNDALSFNSPVEMKIDFVGNENNYFENNEYITFYANGPDKVSYDSLQKNIFYLNNVYSDTAFYLLTFNQKEGKRIESKASLENYSNVIDFSSETFIYESDINNILQSGREWVGELFSNGDSKNINIPSSNLYNNDVTIILSALSRSTDNSKFEISLNNNKVAELNLEKINEDLYGEKVIFSLDTFEIKINDLNNLNLSISYLGTSKSLAYLDYIILNYNSKLIFDSSQKVFNNLNELDSDKIQFNILSDIPNFKIWNITDPYLVINQLYDNDIEKSIFNINSNRLHEYIIFDENNLLIPTSHQYAFSTNNQTRIRDILSDTNVDLLIITDDLFLFDAKRLANFRLSNDKLNTKVVTVDEIYLQFSSSTPDISSIRNYIKYLYEKSSKKLKYVLLFGDASYDYKNRIFNNTNYVPTYQSRNSTNNIYSYSSDDFFGFLDHDEGEWTENLLGDHDLDVGIGRIPVNNNVDSKLVIDKLIRYSSNNDFGRWKNDIYLIADDGDYNIHQINAEKHFDLVDSNNPQFNIKKIFIDYYKQELVGGVKKSIDGNIKLNEAIEQGSLIINYIGHGNEFLWAEERILDENSIEKWNNRSKIPLLVSATCEFGKFDNPLITSGGELMINKGDGGSIALFTTTRPVFSQTNFLLNDQFYKNVFKKQNNNFLRLGDIFRITKNNSLSGPINRNFSLLGDPSLTLNYPKLDIEINIPDSLSIDTLSALEKYSFNGEIINNGKKVENFNGEVFIDFFDKLSVKQTLGDESDPFSFKQWDKSIFRGSSSVNNGNFTFEFVVPKNIEYNFGKAKVTMYATDSLNQIDANGSNIEFNIGGTSKNFSLDKTPPDINIFLNDRTFKSEDNVSSNALLIIDLYDENGINIYNSDYSNNIVATLDDSINFILNDYFISFKDDFKRGSVRYPIENLDIGKHKLEIKVYDTYNNIGNESVLFMVSNDLKIKINNLMNYPNPFSESTSFSFEHDREEEDLEVSIEIINLNGKVIYKKSEIIENSNNLVNGIIWNGKNSNQQIVSDGIYIYKLYVKSLFDGAYNQSYKKMIKRKL